MSDVTRRLRNSDKILWSHLLMILRWCLLRLEVKTKVGEMEKKKRQIFFSVLRNKETRRYPARDEGFSTS